MKSLLSKYFLATATLILISFIILGGGLSLQVYKYSIGEKQQNLNEVATRMSSLTTQIMGQYSGVREQTFRFLLSTMTDNGKIHALICDSNGKIISSSDNDRQNIVGQTVQDAALKNYRRQLLFRHG
ncbi:MAG: hypothetical protein RR994_02080 [Clostridia bacterium]